MTTSAAKANRNAEIVDRLEAEIDRLTAALGAIRDRDDRNGSLPAAYREIIDAAFAPATTGRPT